MTDVESQTNPAEANNGFLSWVKKNPLYVVLAASVLVLLATTGGLHLAGKMPYQDSEEPSELAVTGNQTNSQSSPAEKLDDATLATLVAAQNLAGLNQETLAKLTPDAVNQVTDSGIRNKLQDLLKAKNEKAHIEELLADPPVQLNDADRTLLTVTAVAPLEKYGFTLEQLQKIHELVRSKSLSPAIEYSELKDFLATNKTYNDLIKPENVAAYKQLETVSSLPEDKRSLLLYIFPNLKNLLDRYTEKLRSSQDTTTTITTNLNGDIANPLNPNQDIVTTSNSENTNNNITNGANPNDNQASIEPSSEIVGTTVVTPDALITGFNAWKLNPTINAFIELEVKINSFTENKDTLIQAITVAENESKEVIRQNPMANAVLAATETCTNYYDVYGLFSKLDDVSKSSLRAHVSTLLACKALNNHALLPVFLGFEAHSIARVELDPKLKALGPKGSNVSSTLEYRLFTFKLDTWAVKGMIETLDALKALMTEMNGTKQTDVNAQNYESMLVLFEHFAVTLEAFYSQLKMSENEKQAANMQFQTALMKDTFALMKSLWNVQPPLVAAKVKTFGATMKQADLIAALLEAIKANTTAVLDTVTPVLEEFMELANHKNADMDLFLSQVTILPSMLSLCKDLRGTDLQVLSLNNMAYDVPYVDFVNMNIIDIPKLKAYSKMVEMDIELLKASDDVPEDVIRRTMIYHASLDARIAALENEKVFNRAPLNSDLATAIKDKFPKAEDKDIIDKVFKDENAEKFNDILRLLASDNVKGDADLVSKIVKELATMKYNENLLSKNMTQIQKPAVEWTLILNKGVDSAKKFALNSFAMRYLNSSRDANKTLKYKFDGVFSRNPIWVEPTEQQLDGRSTICDEVKRKMNKYVKIDKHRTMGLTGGDIVEVNIKDPAYLDYPSFEVHKDAFEKDLDVLVAFIAHEPVNRKSASL